MRTLKTQSNALKTLNAVKRWSRPPAVKGLDVEKVVPVAFVDAIGTMRDTAAIGTMAKKQLNLLGSLKL